MFLFYCFHIFFEFCAFFLVKRHKTFFGFGFQILFFGLVILLFWFWVLVKCKKWFFIFCIWFWFFYIFYFILATPPFLYRPSPFYLSPIFYSVNKDQIIFICHPFATATAATAPLLALDPR
jgi:hypothetical protein